MPTADGHSKYLTPESMYSYFEDYRDNVKSTPRYTHEFNSKLGEVVAIPHYVPLSWAGFDTFLAKNDIIWSTRDYRDNKDGSYSDYSSVITRINDEMFEDKYNGASIGEYNANIIARDIGLVDKQAREMSGEVTQKNIISFGGKEVEV